MRSTPGIPANLILLPFDYGELEQLEPGDVVRDGDKVMFSLTGTGAVVDVAVAQLRMLPSLRASIDGAMYDLVSAMVISTEDRIGDTRTVRFCARFMLPREAIPMP